MKIGLLSVGTEILLGDTVNTNLAKLGSQLYNSGNSLTHEITVSDIEEEIIKGFSFLYDNCDVVITCGGLGPTEDDITREVISKHLNIELILDEDHVTFMKQRWQARGLLMPETNIKQAFLPKDSLKLNNTQGTAPGSLIEIDEKFKIFKGGLSVIDIGAAPGSWSQYALKAAKSGKLISIDLKKMEPIGNSVQIQGDFTEEKTQEEIKKHINGKVDVVMSDMAVDTTGIKNIDSIQTGELCKEAMFFAKDLMKENGYFISKIFMGGTFNEIVAEGKKYFKEVKVFKPKSSRKDSKESFIICRKIR